jgi:hypothetical protein
MWMDRRLPCPDLPWIEPENVGQLNTCIDTFMTRSHDAGTTWEPNIRVSEQTWDWRLNLPISGGYGGTDTGFIGDYQGIASSNEYDFPLWAATANLGDNPDNHQQVFVAQVPVQLPPTTSTPTYTATASPTPTATSTEAPSATATPTASASSTVTSTGTAGVTPTSTQGSATPSETAPSVTPGTSTTPYPTPGPWELFIPYALRE